MESVFDRLAHEISSEDRQAFLAKISSKYEADEYSMHESYTDDHQLPDNAEKEFLRLSFMERLRIILIAFFSNRTRDMLTQEFLLGKLRRDCERSLPGLIDFRRKLVSIDLHKSALALQSAANVFDKPLTYALGKHKGDFFALLGRIEFEKIHQRLETEPDPERLSSAFPVASSRDIRKRMLSIFDEILEDIIPDSRRRMQAHTTALLRLRSLCLFPFLRILEAFPKDSEGQLADAPLHRIKNALLELGDILWSFQSAPSTNLIKSLFIFYLKRDDQKDYSNIESELPDYMDRAAEALNHIRKANEDILNLNLLRVLAEDFHYLPRPGDSGESWFHVFKKFWRKRLDDRYRHWSERRRLVELLQKFNVLWEIDFIPPVAGYSELDFPDTIQLRYDRSLAAMRTFFSQIFQSRLYHMLNLIMAGGKFYKKDNQHEYHEVFERLLKVPGKIRALEDRLKPSGEYGVRRVKIRQEEVSEEKKTDKLCDFTRELDRKCQLLLMPVISDLQIMDDLLKGILSEGGGRYDTLINMADIGSRGPKIFQKNLKEVNEIINASVQIFKELTSLEETCLLK